MSQEKPPKITYLGTVEHQNGDEEDYYMDADGNIFTKKGHVYAVACSVNSLLLSGMFLILVVLALVAWGIL